MKKKKVLIIAANGLGNSGVPNVYMQIVRMLSDKCEFDLVITREDYFFKEEFLSYGGKIFLLREKIYFNKPKRIFWRLLASKHYLKKELNKILSEKKYDIIHSFKEGESWIYLKLARKFGVEKRIIHNNRLKDNHKGVFVNYFTNHEINKSIKYSTDNISVSTLSGNSFFNKTKFQTISNTFDEATFYFRESKSSSESPLLLQIGTFLPLKNQLFSLDVLSVLKHTYENVKMIFIGRPYDTHYYSAFENKIKELGLNHNVTILEEFRDKQKILDNATYTLIPSVSEGLSLVAIESQSTGIKVLASPGIPKDVDLGNISFINLDPVLWADNINRDFTKNHHKRKKVDTTPFSSSRFLINIQKLYNLD